MKISFKYSNFQLENGNIENGHSEEAATNGNGTTNGHDSPATESLNGDFEHEKVRHME